MSKTTTTKKTFREENISNPAHQMSDIHPDHMNPPVGATNYIFLIVVELAHGLVENLLNKLR